MYQTYIEDYKIIDYYDDNFRVMKKFVEYEPEAKNINILDGEIYKGAKNKYIIDLTKFWFCDYNETKWEKREKAREYELRRSVYDTIRSEYYIDRRECLDVMYIYESKMIEISEFLIEEFGKYFFIQEEHVTYEPETENLNISNKEYALETNWGDGTINNEKEHLYIDYDIDEENYIYEIETTGFIDTVKYTHTGKSLVNIDRLRLNIADGSWLFAEHYYATSNDFFPVLNTRRMTNMSHMYYHCSRVVWLDLSEYNTRNTKDMSHMFNSCLNLEILNLDFFNMENTKYTDGMLMNCINLYEIRLDNCKYETIKKIIESKYFPEDKIIELPTLHTIEFDEEAENFIIPSYTIDELNDENNTMDIFEDYVEYLKQNDYINEVNIFYRPGCFIRRSIFCRPENRKELIAPKGWRFVNVY